jgi:hypothetical protein
VIPWSGACGRAARRKGSDDDDDDDGDDDDDSPKPRGKPKKGDKVAPKDKGPKGKRRPFDDSGSDDGSDGACSGVWCGVFGPPMPGTNVTHGRVQRGVCSGWY